MFTDRMTPCSMENGLKIFRTAQVNLHCCLSSHYGIFISQVLEVETCKYIIDVCSEDECHEMEEPDEVNDFHHRVQSINQTEQLIRVRDMFYHAFNGYMEYAYPAAELQPISCQPGQFELVKLPLVTLIDSLDTLVIMGDHETFRRGIDLILDTYPSFELDVNVSVFETTIRVLGGLLSSHLFAIDPKLQVYRNDDMNSTSYTNQLLTLAIDLGDRLLEAFDTLTGIPYGTVNLMYGVPPGEIEEASTAGAGSLLLEFQVLSILSGEDKYGDAAYRAMEALFSRRSHVDLLGKHIHIRTGKWTEEVSGVGSNADSFYEYLLKGALLFPDRSKQLLQMFLVTYLAIKKHVQRGDWFVETEMYHGLLRRTRSENLQAFWPGMEAMMGMLGSSSKLLNAFYTVWNTFDVLPEEFDSSLWNDKNREKMLQGVIAYPLRPELIESTYYQYRATKDKTWLVAAVEFLDSLEDHSQTSCGYASLSRVLHGSTMKQMIHSFQQVDNMPSYFLSETVKYLYLIFDEDNFIHNQAYLFSTEAHPFDPMQLSQFSSYRRKKASTIVPIHNQDMNFQCPKATIYDAETTYRPEFLSVSIEESTRRLRRDYEGYSIFLPIGIGLRRKKYCAIDEPPNAIASKSVIKMGAVDSTSQIAELEVPSLGKFSISLYSIAPGSAGYRIQGDRDNLVLELSNIGQDSVYVGEYYEGKQGYLKNILFTSHHRIQCEIQILVNDTATITEDELQITSHKRHCSMAMFGATAQADKGIVNDFNIVTEMLYLDSIDACAPLVGDAAEESHIVNRWWGQEKRVIPNQYKGKIIVVKRGTCAFEEKAMNIQRTGAIAVIIENSEDVLFVMAGLEQQGKSISSHNKVTLPTVMLTKYDSTSLLKDIKLLKDRSHHILVSVNVRKIPNAVDIEAFGEVEYPKGTVSSTSVAIASSGVWGVKLWLVDNQWQIMVSNKYAASFTTNNMWTVLSAEGFPLTTALYGTLNPLEMYKLHVSEQCPATLSFDQTELLMRLIL